MKFEEVFKEIYLSYVNQLRNDGIATALFIDYAHKLISSNLERIKKFQYTASVRGQERKISQAIEVIVLYNFLHYNNIMPGLSHDFSFSRNSKNRGIASFILAGGDGTRLSLIGADQCKPLIEVPVFGKLEHIIGLVLKEIYQECDINFVSAGKNVNRISRFWNMPEIVYLRGRQTPKQEAFLRMSEALEKREVDIILRLTADVYRKPGILERAINFHYQDEPENSATIIVKPGSIENLGLSIQNFNIDDDRVAEIYKFGNPNFGRAGYFGIKCGSIWGMEFARRFIRGNNNSDYFYSQNRVKVFFVEEDEAFSIDDVFSLMDFIKYTNKREPRDILLDICRKY
ncbi:hypothetical protein FJZ19_00290 [Candidatus Pacearchaeota archaeon]|nr:hypothetical protein [Candidatus Pacearchaeota archaeon]